MYSEFSSLNSKIFIALIKLQFFLGGACILNINHCSVSSLCTCLLVVPKEAFKLNQTENKVVIEKIRNKNIRHTNNNKYNDNSKSLAISYHFKGNWIELPK